MTDFIKKASLYISSNDRQTSDPIDNINVTIHEGVKLNDVRKIEVREAIIPITVYNVTTGVNDGFTVTDSTTTQYVITIAEGSYSTASMAQTLALYLNYVSSDTFTVSYDAKTFKYVIKNTTGAFAIDANATSVYSTMGFAVGSSAIPAATALNQTPVNEISGSAVFFGLPLYLYIESQDLAISNYTNVLSTNVNETQNIIAKIPITTNSGGVVFQHFTDHDTTQQISQSGTSLPQRLNIRLRLPNNNDFKVIIGDWSLSLIVHYE